MTKKNTFILGFLSIALFYLSPKGYSQDSISLKKPHKLAVGLSIGTTPGLTFAYGVSEQLSLRLGYSFFNYTHNTTMTVSGENIKLKGDVNMSLVSLAVEYHPFKKSSFKVFGGAGYIDKGDMTVVETPTGTYQLGNIVLTPEQIGNVNLKADYGKSIAPFAGIGFGRSIPKKRVGLGIEVGSYYMNVPKVSLTGEGRLSNMSEQQAKVQENMKEWRYWPVANLRLSIRLD